MVTNFQHQQAIEYYGKGKTFYEKSKLSLVNNVNRQNEKHDHLYETASSYDYFVPKQNIEPLIISHQNIQPLLDMSFEHTCILLNEETLYVFDISHFKASPFNTIVFQLNQAPLKTAEYSGEIMERYFKHKGISYKTISLLGRSLGIQKCCPYVLGEEAFVPEKGPSSAHTNWYGMHHVLHAEKNSKDGLTYLFCRNQHRLLLPLGKRGYHDQLERAASLYYVQQLLKGEVMSIFHLVSNFNYQAERNVIQKRLQFHTPELPEFFTLRDYFCYLDYFKIQEGLTRILGEENPYIEEIMNHFKIPPFPFNFS